MDEDSQAGDNVASAFEERDKYIDLCVDLFLKQPNVQDVLVINDIGNPLRSTMDADISVKYGGMVDQLIGRSVAVVKEIDDSELEQIRIMTKKYEIFILPDQYQVSFVVNQTPIDENHPD